MRFWWLWSREAVYLAGYGLDTDVRILVMSCPPFEQSLTHVARFVDLCPLSKEVGAQLILFIPIMFLNSIIQ